MRALHAGKSPVIFLDEASVLDIGACIVDAVNIAPGLAIPNDGDPRIYHSLEGFLFTCGPDHIRHPQPIEGDALGRKYPLHGSFSANAAEIRFWSEENGDAEVHATVPLQLAHGGQAVLDRRWRVDGKTGEVRLDDRVTNTGDEAFPAFLMYHMNIGGRLLDGDVLLSGDMLENSGFPWRFGAEPGGVFCVAAAEPGVTWAELRLGPIAALGGKTLTVRFATDTLPYLQIWRNQKAPANVLGIEPVSHRWVSRSELGGAGEFDMLDPGESRNYALRFSIV
jgi:hypothetical protein